MIYDYMDIATKAGIASACKAYLKETDKAAEIIKLMEIMNLSGKPVPKDTGDLILFNMLQMIGAGYIVPVMEETMGFMFPKRYTPPKWVWKDKYWNRLNLHVEQILDAMDILEKRGQIPLLKGSMAVVFQDIRINSIPQDPITDVDHNLGLVAKRKKEYREHVV